MRFLGEVIVSLFHDRQHYGSFISREISLRITALRETFEELGLLLVKNAEQLRASSPFSVHRHDFDVAHWQNEVNQSIKPSHSAIIVK